MSQILTPRKNSLSISDTVKSNLKFLQSILHENDSLISLSSSQQQYLILNEQLPQQKIRARKYFEQIRTLLKNCGDSFKCVGLYSRLLQLKRFQGLPSDPLFSGTFYNAGIHSLLTCYLEQETPYYQMRLQTEKILDIFYKYIFCEHGELMEINLRDGVVSNLGKWFYEEGIEKMFKKYYYSAHQFTKFISQFMLHGVAALFLAAVSILSQRPHKFQTKQLQIIEIAYLRKYGLFLK